MDLRQLATTSCSDGDRGRQQSPMSLEQIMSQADQAEDEIRAKNERIHEELSKSEVN